MVRPRWLTLALLVAGTAYTAAAWRIPVRPIAHDPGARVVPLVVGILTAGLALWELRARQVPNGAGQSPAEAADGTLDGWLCLAASAVYLAVLRPLGFVAATAALLFGLGAYLRSPAGWRQWLGLAAFALFTAWAVERLFGGVFGVPLPSGGWGAP